MWGSHGSGWENQRTCLDLNVVNELRVLVVGSVAVKQGFPEVLEGVGDVAAGSEREHGHADLHHQLNDKHDCQHDQELQTRNKSWKA